MARIGRITAGILCSIALVACQGGCGRTVQSSVVIESKAPPGLSEQTPTIPEGLKAGPRDKPLAQGTVLSDRSTAETAILRAPQEAQAAPPLPLTGEQGVTEAGPPRSPDSSERIEESVEVAAISPQLRRDRAEIRTAETPPGLKDVLFGFDSWMINDDAKEILASDAVWLRSHQAPIAIEGHCDERGTQAYNLVLGEKRARAIKSYLVDLGIDPSTLSIVSYGKERPLCVGHAEGCHQQNRRGHLALSRD